MNIKYLIIFTLMLILAMSAVSANENITELQTADDAKTLQAVNDSEILEATHNVKGNTFSDIQKSIDNAKDKDIINLKGDYTSSGKAITITKSITIEGNGATLDAKKKSTVFNIKSKSLTLKNLKIINSKGTAITSKNCDLTLINCTLTNNGGQEVYHKTEYGYYIDVEVGALNAYKGKLNIIDSTFSKNLGDNTFAVRAEKATVTIENSVFTNHKTSKDLFSEGTVVDLINSPAKIIDSKFKGNEYPVLYMDSNSLIGNTIFENNKNCIFVSGSDPSKKSKIQFTITKSRFISNENAISSYWDIDLNIDNCKFNSNSNSAIIYQSSTINIKNSEFNSNSAKKGGAINGYGVLTVTNSKFNGNSAQYGGTIYSESFWNEKDKYSNSITIINSTITNSKATKNGGAIYGEVADITLKNTNVTTQSSSQGSQVYLRVGSYNAENSTKLSVKKISKIAATVKVVGKTTTTYDSNKKIGLELRYNNGKDFMPVSKLKFKVYTGKKYKIYYYNPKSGHINPYLRIVSSMSVGKHKVVVMSNGKYFTLKKYKFTITIKKAKTKVSAKKVTAKYKKSKYFKATIKNKASNKVVKGIKVKVKVYTGKHAKTYILKTNKKGVVKLDTKKLKRGTHKVKITSKNSKYEISKESSIKIK